jgi:hypothetical protein
MRGTVSAKWRTQNEMGSGADRDRTGDPLLAKRVADSTDSVNISYFLS